MSSIHFTHVYASPLQRAHSTAQAIVASQPSPKPPLTLSPDVREQHFGVAEGKPWRVHLESGVTREEHYAKGIFPVIYDREDKFPEGESMNDLAARANRAVWEIVVPYVKEDAENGTSAHIAIVSHGLCISELVAAVLRLDLKSKNANNWTGLLNTAWTRVKIELNASRDFHFLAPR